MFPLRLLALSAAGILSACFGTEATVFPAGLEPLENNRVEPRDPASHVGSIALTDGEGPEFLWVHGRGYLAASPSDVWRVVKNPDLMTLNCDADRHSYEMQDNPSYELSYLGHFVVESLVTVEWDVQWRYGTITGTPEEPALAMVRHQKVFGSTAIDLIEGSLQVLATEDQPGVTELQLVDHLAAFGGTVEDLRLGMQYRFDTIMAALQGGQPPACP